MSIYLGIDVGKFIHVAYYLDERGNRLGHLKFDNDLAGFTELEKLIGGLSIPDNGNIFLGMEATAHYWLPLYEFLKSKGYKLQVFSPFKVNRFRDFYIQPTMDFPQDAFVIANILRHGKVKPTVLPPENIQKLKRTICYRRFLIKEMAQIKNKIRCMLDELFPEYQSVPFFTKEIEDRLSLTPGKILTSIPGIGPLSAATIISEIGDTARFRSAGSLTCYYGLIPSSHSSGTFKRNGIAKKEKSSLAHLFYQIALSSLRCNPTLREHYENKIAQGKPKKIVLVAVARKLVRIVYSMLKNAQPYKDSQRTKEPLL